MIRNIYKETRAVVSWSFEKKRGLGKNHLVEGKIDGTRERGRPRRQWEENIRVLHEVVCTSVNTIFFLITGSNLSLTFTL